MITALSGAVVSARRHLPGFLQSTDALKGEMATKNDLGRLETTMHSEFERVHIRLDSIDRGMGGRMGQIETEISRLRSVEYLLVKDKPEMLRLLGQPTPGESRP